MSDVMVKFRLVRGKYLTRGRGQTKNTEAKQALQEACVASQTKQQLENGRHTENAAKAKNIRVNQSSSLLRTQQPRQAVHARETGAGLLKERSGATRRGREQN
eukprot:1149188-Pelagomonas_calceolata.AAC.2